MHVFPTAPSPTTTHLNLIFSELSSLSIIKLRKLIGIWYYKIIFILNKLKLKINDNKLIN